MKLECLENWPDSLSDFANKNIEMWLELCKESPSRFATISDVIVRTQKENMEHVYISEWKSFDRVVVMWSGIQLDKFLGHDIAGKDIFSYLPKKEAAREMAYYDALRKHPCGGVLVRNTQGLNGENISYITTQLPLCNELGEVKYFMGSGEGRKFHDDVFIREKKDIVAREMYFIDLGYGTPNHL